MADIPQRIWHCFDQSKECYMDWETTRSGLFDTEYIHLTDEDKSVLRGQIIILNKIGVETTLLRRLADMEDLPQEADYEGA